MELAYNTVWKLGDIDETDRFEFHTKFLHIYYLQNNNEVVVRGVDADVKRRSVDTTRQPSRLATQYTKKKQK